MLQTIEEEKNTLLFINNCLFTDIFINLLNYSLFHNWSLLLILFVLGKNA